MENQNNLKNTDRSRIIEKKIRTLFPETPEAKLMLAIVVRAVQDASTGKGVKSAAGKSYLRGNMPHAEICGVNPGWIRRVIKKVGLSIEFNQVAHGTTKDIAI